MVSRISLYISAMRPKDSATYLPITIGAMFLGWIFFSVPVSVVQFVQVLAVMSVYSLFSLCSNNFFDRKADAINRKKISKNPYAAGNVSRNEMIFLNMLLITAMFAMVYAWLYSLLVPLALFALNMVLYTKYFKKMPVLDLVSHFIGYFSFFLFPALVMGLGPDVMLIFSLAFIAMSNLATLEGNQNMDIESDRRAGIRSTTVVFGRKISRMISYCSVILIFVFIGGFSLVLGSLLPCLLLPLAVLTLMRTMNSDFMGKNYDKAYFAYVVLLGLMLLAYFALF